MSAIQFKIMVMAVRIRYKRGEKLDDILASYPNLTGEEKQKIKDIVENK